MPSFTRAPHAQPSLSNFTRRDSEFGERARSRGTTRLEQKFPTSPQNKKTKLTHCSIYVPMRTISLESIDPDQKGSKYNVMVEWESGEVTYEPLTLISKDDPINCAVYAKKHDLLDTTGWNHPKRYAKISKRLIRAVKQSWIHQVRASARYQHGFQVPKDYNDAIRLDKENSMTEFRQPLQVQIHLEMSRILVQLGHTQRT